MSTCLRYDSPSSKKNYQLRKRQRVNLTIKCLPGFIKKIRETLKYSKFELSSLEDLNRSKDGLIILKLELVSKAESLNSKDIDIEVKELIENLNNDEDEEILAIYSYNNCQFDHQNNYIDLSLEEKVLLIRELTNRADKIQKYIYVITPKGDVIKLPKKSTCVDFAYAIHSDIGDRCKGVKVNDQIVKLNTCLSNGDKVEVITHKNSYPSRDWLGFVVTNKAVNRIKRALKQLHWEQNIATGRELLHKQLEKDDLESFLGSKEMDRVIRKCNCKNQNSLLALVGYGEISVQTVINLIKENKSQLKKNPQLSNENIQVSNNITSPSDFTIKELEGISYRIARCCNPIPGEPIIGVVTRVNKGITIHSKECRNWENIPVEQLITVTWKSCYKNTFPIYVQIKMLDEVGLLQLVSSEISRARINIRKAGIETHPQHMRNIQN